MDVSAWGPPTPFVSMATSQNAAPMGVDYLLELLTAQQRYGPDSRVAPPGRPDRTIGPFSTASRWPGLVPVASASTPPVLQDNPFLRMVSQMIQNPMPEVQGPFYGAVGR
jgi:hypothetical protein